MTIGAISADDRASLLRKYRLLAEWRRVRDGGRGVAPDRAALRALSSEFPGALRELDLLGEDEIQRRIGVLEAGEGDGGAWPAWTHWILAYHRLMLAALAVKRAARRTRRMSAAALAEALAAANALAAGQSVDESFARAAAQPAAGRLTVVVLRTLARRFDVPAHDISTALFPPRRPAPYEL